jgi:hypothetical protein
MMMVRKTTGCQRNEKCATGNDCRYPKRTVRRFCYL